MASIKETAAELRDSFLAMPMPTRVIGGGMVAVIAIALWMLTGSVGSNASMEVLFNGKMLTDDEIFKVQGALARAQLRNWDVEHNRILVPSKYKAEYIRAIDEANAMPLEAGTYFAEAQQQSSPFDTERSRQSREHHAKERDLGKQIATFESISHATVEHDMVSKGYVKDHRQSAHVLVTPTGSDPLPPHMIRAIKNMVQGCYAGLKSDDIHVTDVNADGLAMDDEDNPLFKARIKYEKYFLNKARQLLKGFGQLSIDATVELDPTMDVERARLQFGDPTALQEQITELTMESSRPQPGGVPGTASNVGNRPVAIDPSSHTSRTTQKSDSSSKVAGEEFEASRIASLQPKRLSFSIGVPESLYERIWRDDFLRANPDAKPEDLPPMTAEDRSRLKASTVTDIKTALQTMLLAGAAGEDKYPLIEVWDHRDLPELPADEPSAADRAISWLASSWQTLAMLGLAVVALLVARSVLASGSGGTRKEFDEGFGLEIPVPSPEDVRSEASDASGNPRLTITGQHLKEELSEMVGANPEAAANVLRSWLDNAAAA